MKFHRLTPKKLPFYRDYVDCLQEDPDAEFFCFVADRLTADPVERFGTQWDAYGKLAEQLVHAITAPDEILTVLADNYSTPSDVRFESTLRRTANGRMGRLAVASVVRLDSRTTDGLQLVDLLTSSVAFEFRAAAGLASSWSKGQMAHHVRSHIGASTCTSGFRSNRFSVAIYDHGSWHR